MGFLYCYIEHGSMDLVIKIPYFFDSFNGPRSVCTTKERGSFFTRETVQRMRLDKLDDQAKYTPKGQNNKPYKAVEAHKVAAPRCTVVAGQIDLYTGGKGARTPMRKLIPISDRVLSIKTKE
jgi:hypothetical protein